MALIIPVELIDAGDVLLCYKSDKRRLEQKVSDATASSYTHAAICIGDGRTAGATFSGITIEPVADLVAAFDHLAVFRQPYAWDERRKQQLPVIVSEIIASGPKYNFAGVKAFQEAKALHADTTDIRLAQYFEGIHEPNSQRKEAYFCSEFVAACFILTGIIEPSASIVYDPAIISPGELGTDATWGYFLGYVTSNTAYEVPVHDEFFHMTPLDDGDEQY